jgi:tRNA pseudouridine38-40 synthase
MFNGPVLSPFLHNQVFHTRRKVNLERMQQASQDIQGRHDFSGFAASGSMVRSHVRTVFVSRWLKKGHFLTYQIVGDGFLHHMVRNIVGTLLEIGTGRREVDDVPRILTSQDRRQAGPTAPAQGLYLVRVWYSGQAGA